MIDYHLHHCSCVKYLKEPQTLVNEVASGVGRKHLLFGRESGLREVISCH